MYTPVICTTNDTYHSLIELAKTDETTHTKSYIRRLAFIKVYGEYHSMSAMPAVIEQFKDDRNFTKYETLKE